MSIQSTPVLAPAPSSPRPAPREWHAVAATAFLAAWLAFTVFVALYRAPLPADAFTALGEQIAAGVTCFAKL